MIMDPILLLKQTNFSKFIWWKLKVNISCYKNETGFDLVTEVPANRLFRLIESNLSKKIFDKRARLFVQFFEDGYICWININNLIIERTDSMENQDFYYDQSYLKGKMKAILNWIQIQHNKSNEYLWGGTLGPNYDCSGLIQTAFYKQKIYIPRDSFQIKNFCMHLFDFPNNIDSLEMGDLLFFGNSRKCDHIGIYFKDGYYYHSSGKKKGRDGIGIDSLIDSPKDDQIALFYRSQLISAGRVCRSYRWDKTLR